MDLLLKSSWWREWSIAILLAGITLSIYWPVQRFDLIYYDDPVVLTDCQPVQAGLTWASLGWALTSVVIANWHPVTNLSFLLVSQFFGTAPGAHHLANAVIHAANAALLFLLLRRLTGTTWRSIVVAAIFAWHPLRVESVAWIAERKDVLCGFFYLLALWFYAQFSAAVKAGVVSPADAKRKRTGFYIASLLAFVLALLSKPMAVTLPVVLLLLDVWPLNRMEKGKWLVAEWKKVVLEKWPFFALTLVFCVATYWIQHDYTAMTSFDVLSLDRRLANAISSCVEYVAQLFWPVNLAAIYPFPKDYDITETALKAGLLVSISLGCVSQFKVRPWLAVGWCWYLVTSLPVIGLVQVGEQAMADRYTYLPLIGPVVALVWTCAELFSSQRGGKVFLTTATVMILSALGILSARQLEFWRNTIVLFEHNLAVTPNNDAAYFTLGLGFEHAGDTNRAITCYRVAKMLSPNDSQTARNLASLLFKKGEFAAAENEYAELAARNPLDLSARLCLANALTAQGRDAEAATQLNEAVRLNPDSAEALNNLAWVLATNMRAEIREGPRAVEFALRACDLTKYKKTIYIGTLGAAYAEAGRFDEAIIAAQKACDLAAKNGETNLLQRNLQLVDRYRRHKTAANE